MQQLCSYNPAERQREKQRQRADDDLQLRQGLVSRADIRARNGFLSSLDIVGSSIAFRDNVA